MLSLARLFFFAAVLAAGLTVAQHAPAVTCSGNLVCNQNPTTAPILLAPKVYVVWWGWTTDTANEKNILRDLLQNIGGSKYLNTVTQYTSYNGRCGNPVSLWGGEISDNVNPLPPGSAYPTDAQFDAEATWALGQFSPAPVDDGIIIIALPHGVAWPAGSCGQHRSVARSGQHPRIAIVEYPYQADNMTYCYPGSQYYSDAIASVATHEIAEAITDPRYDAGPTYLAWVDNTGAELADKCNTNLRVRVSATAIDGVPSLWSNVASSGAGTCVFAHATRHDLFYLATDGTLRHLPIDYYSGPGSWESWGTRSGVTLTSSPGVASWSNSRVDAFAYDSSGNLSHAYWGGSGSPGWNSWDHPTGYSLVYSPDAASWGPSRIDVTAVGQSGSTFKVFHRSWDNGTYSVWGDWGAPAGVTITSRAAIASWGPSRIDLFVLSSATPPDVWHGVSTDGSTLAGWNNWGHPSGVTLMAAPDASSWGDQRLDVFAVDTSGNLWHQLYDHGSFPPWESWSHPGSGVFTTGPGAVGGGDQRLFVSADGGGTGTVWEQIYFNAQSSWIDRGGTPWSRPDSSAW